MAVTYEDSRYLRSYVVRLVGPGGVLIEPQWLDFSLRVSFTRYFDNTYQVVSSTTSWAHLGLKFLGDARAWWAIAEFNNILDPFEELEAAGESETPVTWTIPSLTTFAFNVSPAGGRFQP